METRGRRSFLEAGARLTLALLLVLGAAVAPADAQLGNSQTTDAAEILGAMDAYIGHWRTEEKQDPDGNRFHYEYGLEWMDEGRTIARMIITRVHRDGRTVVFEGYKGREPSGEGVYYFAVSPSGRGARGEVVLEGEDLVTNFDGWGADGSVVQIRDVFEPPEADGDAFRNRTYLRSGPDAEWRQIGGDRWTRADPDQ